MTTTGGGIRFRSTTSSRRNAIKKRNQTLKQQSMFGGVGGDVPPRSSSHREPMMKSLDECRRDPDFLLEDNVGGDDDDDAYFDNANNRGNATNRIGAPACSLRLVPHAMQGTSVDFVEPIGIKGRPPRKIECLPCYVAIVQGQEYLVGLPVDAAVSVCHDTPTDLIPIHVDDELLDDVFPFVQETLAEFVAAAQSKSEHRYRQHFDERIELKRTPQIMTLSGGAFLTPEEQNSPDQFMSYNSVQEMEQQFKNQQQQEQDLPYQVISLMTFEYNGKPYCLIRHVEPYLVLAKLPPASSLSSSRKQQQRSCLLLTDSELARVQPILDQATPPDFDDDQINRWQEELYREGGAPRQYSGDDRSPHPNPPDLKRAMDEVNKNPEWNPNAMDELKLDDWKEEFSKKE